MAEDAKNIRSVIKNATSGGLLRKGDGGVVGKGDTIATKEEISKEREKPATPSLGKIVKPAEGGNVIGLKKAVSTPKSEVVSQPKVDSGIQNIQGGININQQKTPSSPFQNTMNEPIDNISVAQIDGVKQESGIERRDSVLRKGVNNNLVELEKDKKKRISQGVENLYIDAYNTNVDGGTLTIDDILNNKKYQEQFRGVDEKTIAQMLDDANILASGEYDTNNVLALMDKYNELGLEMDLDSLPPETKAQYVRGMLEGNDGGLAGFVNHISPLNIAGSLIEGTTGVDIWEKSQDIQDWAEENKQDFLTESELAEMISNKQKNLDKKYEKYYTNDAEFVDKDIERQVQLEYDKWLGSQMVTTPEQRKAKKEEIIKNMGFSNLPKEGKDWTDDKMRVEYEKELSKIQKEAKKAHGDTTVNWFKNLGLDTILVLGQGVDLARNLGTLGSSLFRLGKGAIHKSIEGYADLLDTWVATTESAINSIKTGEDWKIEYRTGEIGEKVAQRKGYEDYADMVNKMEQASEDNPVLGIATWFLREGEKDLDTANSMLDYLESAYGGVENIKQSVAENPVQVASDVISILQLGVMGAKRMGVIDATKANKMIKVLGYGDMYEQSMNLTNKLQFGPLLKAEVGVVKVAGRVASKPLKFGKNILDVFVNNLSGLTKEEREFIKGQPELVDRFLNGEANSQTLLDRIVDKFRGLQIEKKIEGEEYDKIHQSNKPVKLSNILNDVSSILRRGGLELTNEGININKNYTPKINRKFEEMAQFINELRAKGNSLTAEDAHWVRRQIDTLADWEGYPKGLEVDADNIIRDVRRAIDNELRRAVPELKEVDAKYVATKDEIKTLMKDWFDKDGNLKDSAYSKIRNITNKGSNEPKLKKLEKLIPGITEELMGFAVAESVEKAGRNMVGQYAKQIFGAGGGILAITSLLSGGFSVGPLVLGMLGATMATPKNFIKLLKFQGNLSKAMSNIVDKIGNGIKLTDGETGILAEYLNKNQKNLTKDAEYLYRKGLITDEEYKQAIQNKEKEVKKTGKMEKNDYKDDVNLDNNQTSNGVNEKAKDDTGKSQENLGGLAKKEKGADQGGVGSKASQEARNDGGRVSQGDGGYLELKTDGDAIVKNLEKIKGEQPEGFKMDIHGSADYGNGKRKTFQSADGNSSVTVKDDGDITSLVSKKGLGRGKELVLTAIKNGGDKLDCYEDKLPDLYQKAGFEPVARVKFNAEYAPADWKGKGQDIIVMMRRNNDSVEKVSENWDKYEKIDLDDLPVMEYDDALAYRDMLLAERKKSYKPKKVEEWVQTDKGLKKKKTWSSPSKPLWGETINPDTGKAYTAQEVDAKMGKIRDKYVGNKNKLRELYNKYVDVNNELGKDLQDTFKKDGYINPDGLRPLINREFAREMGVGDNIMASTNHPAVSKVADAFVEMIGDDMVAKAKKGDNVTVALIGGGGGSGKSGGPKAMISEGFIKDGQKVDMTLDVQGGANDLKGLIEKAKKEGVLDKFNFKIAYVYASTEEAGRGVINRTINQNERLLKSRGLNPKVVAQETELGKNRLYAGRTLPFDIFEGGHLKSIGEKGLKGYIEIAKEVDNVDFMITERVPGDRKDTTKHIVKKGNKWLMTEKEINDLVNKMEANKKEGLSKVKDKLREEGEEAVRKGLMSKNQLNNLFGV